MSDRPLSPSAPRITRLTASDAAAVVDCFRRVYADSYANPLFYDAEALASAIVSGSLCPVGAWDDAGRLLAHMAMSRRGSAATPELGNTVVDPAARGAGLAWRVGAALIDWCRALGHAGYLHFPTTAHHIMQRESVKRGVETGLMLGYIHPETDGQTGGAVGPLRRAATVVYEPLAEAPAATAVLPEIAQPWLPDMAQAAGLTRHWRRAGDHTLPASSRVELTDQPQRGLARLAVHRAGADLPGHLDRLRATGRPCLQIDLCLDDAAAPAAAKRADEGGWCFSAWLPGYQLVAPARCADGGSGDVLRLQRVDPRQTDFAPQLVNPVARRLLEALRPTAG